MSDFFQMMFQGAAGAGGGGLNVEDVFSIDLYTGNGSSQTITNNIDLAGEGGAVIFKSRTTNEDFHTYDTVRGARKRIALNQTTQEYSGAATYGLTSFNSDGFSVGSTGAVNGNGINLVSWTFRKAPKFFDVQKWGGNEVSGRQISHNLGVSPGVVIIKKRDYDTNYVNWFFWHKDLSANKFLALNTTNAQSEDDGDLNYYGVFNSVPDANGIYLENQVNQNQYDYVAYFFAHNNNDGEFGPNSDQDIIKCGSYTGNGQNYLQGGNYVNIGFEPQWVMIFPATVSGYGNSIFDNLRGMAEGNVSQDFYVSTSSSSSEASYSAYIAPTPNGFKLESSSGQVNENNQTYVYIAIRYGFMADIQDADDVFAIDKKEGSSDQFYAPWPADFALQKNNVDDIGNVAPWLWTTRDMNDAYVSSNNNSNQSTNNFGWDTSKGLDARDNALYDPSDFCWMWRKKEGFFDSIVYIGDRFASGGHTVNHGLGVVPEMFICKGLDDTGNWAMYHSALGATKGIEINNGTAAVTSSGFWNNTAPTSTTIKLGTNSHTNNTGYRHVGLFFASVPGICKVGSYTGTGSTQNIDCGFSNGAKLVMLKNADQNEEFLFFDSERGIISGNSPYLQLGSNAYQFSSQNYLSPYSAGFTVPGGATNNNSSGDTFIYYAIANP